MDYTLFDETLTKAEEAERQARALHDQNLDTANLALQQEIKELFEKAWQGYREVENVARNDWQKTNSKESCMLLAQALMDSHIHPNSGLARDSKKLWEAQYLWLHLYFQTGNQSFFDQAIFCDGIRHATVTKE